MIGRECAIAELGATLLATFTLLASPLRATGCRLMRKADGEFMVWTAHPTLKINQKKNQEVAKLVIEQIEAANIIFTGPAAVI